VPSFLGTRGLTPYHRLNPLTKLVLAATTAVGAFVLGGYVGPLILAAVAIGVPAVVGRVVRPLLKATLLLSLPIGLSALIVNIFFFPGHEVLFTLGPVTATVEGVMLALEILLRILVISGAVTLFYLGTRPAELVADLERRGVSPRLAFVIHATASTVPQIAQRALMIIDAQRARGLDTQGGLFSRVRGIVPIAGPVVLGSISEVEERSMALEARAFTRPGRRSLLWHPADSSAERLLRWGLVAALVVLFVARVAGWTP
jgi:energy-coupling factor transport system permease protein